MTNTKQAAKTTAKQLAEITFDDLTALADGLTAQDWAGFADRVAQVNPIIGATTAMHAEASDGNSPDVADWPRYTLDECHQLLADGIDSPAAAMEWWEERYTEVTS